MSYALPFALAAGAMLAAGCSQPLAGTAQAGPSPSAAGPALDAKHALSQERHARAMNGLEVRNGMLVVTQPAPGNAAQAARLLARAQATLATNTWFESCEAYGKALAAAPQSAAAYEGFATGAMLDLKADLAMPALLSALAIEPGRQTTRYRLAELHQMDGNYGMARAEWGKCDPSFRDVEARLALASYYDNDLDSARAHLARAKSLGQNVPPQFESLVAMDKEGRP